MRAEGSVDLCGIPTAGVLGSRTKLSPNPEWLVILFSKFISMIFLLCMLTHFSHVWLFADRMEPTRLLCPWDSPGKNTGVGCRALLQAVFLTQGSNPGLLRRSALAGGFFTPAPPGKPVTAEIRSKEPSLLNRIKYGLEVDSSFSHFLVN